MQATKYSSSGSLIPGEQMVHFNQFELALSNTEHNFFIYPSSLEKKKLICQWCERMYLCGFVAFSVRMCVAEANKVEGTMS